MSNRTSLKTNEGRTLPSARVCTNTVRVVSTAWGKSCQRSRDGVRMNRSASKEKSQCAEFLDTVSRHNTSQ